MLKLKPRNNDPIEWITLLRKTEPRPEPPIGYVYFTNRNHIPLQVCGAFMTARKETNNA